MATEMVTARLGQDLARTLRETAAADCRSRTDQIAYLMRLGLLARERIAEFEALAAATIASQNLSSTAGTEAAAAHLAEHRRLAGIKES